MGYVFTYSRNRLTLYTHQDRRKVNTLIPSGREANPEGLVLCCVSNVDLLGWVVSRYKPTPPKNQDKVIEQMTLLGSSHIYLGRSAFYFRTDTFPGS